MSEELLLTLGQGCAELLAILPRGFSMRELGSGDKKDLFEHWAALGAEDLMSRFFSMPSREALEKRAMETDFSKTRMAGVFDASGKLVSVSQWARETSEVGESAFSTLPEFRKLGLAKAAALACALEARALGLRMLRMETLRRNHAARSLGQALGGVAEEVDYEEDYLVTWLDLVGSSELDALAKRAKL